MSSGEIAKSTGTPADAVIPAAGEASSSTPAGAESAAGGEGSAASTSVRLHLPWLDSIVPTGGAQAGGGTAAPTRPRSIAPTPASTVNGASGAADTTTPLRVAAPSAHAARLDAGSQSATDATQTTAGSETTASVQPTSSDSSAGVQTAAASSIAGATSSAASESTPWIYGTNMQQTIETIHATVALVSRQGAASAQIQLEPAELGVVKIHLTQTSEGLLARVSAETAAGAQAIASGRSELHQTLSSLGISLLRLDVGGSFARQEAQAQGNAPQGSGQRPERLGGIGEEAEEAASTTSTAAVSLSSSSALIDVLA